MLLRRHYGIPAHEVLDGMPWWETELLLEALDDAPPPPADVPLPDDDLPGPPDAFARAPDLPLEIR